MRAAVVTLAVTLFGVFASEAAPARKGSGSGGGFKHPSHYHGVVGVGVGIGWPYWGYAPPYYYPAYYPVPQSPIYVEQDPAPASEPGAWWYYCESAAGYYPHVTECPSGWERVAPAAPPPE